MAKLVFIIAPKNFRDEEYFEPKTVLDKTGHHITTASTKTGTIIGSKGSSATATLKLENVSVLEFDAVVFVGGPGSYQLDHNSEAQRIAQEFFNAGKLTAAICHGPIILAQAGILTGKRATVFSGDAEELAKLGVKYLNQSVVIEGIIITADGPNSAKEFGQTIAQVLPTA